MADGDWPQEENAVILAVHLSAALEVRQLERDLLALVRHLLLYHNHPGRRTSGIQASSLSHQVKIVVSTYSLKGNLNVVLNCVGIAKEFVPSLMWAGTAPAHGLS